jgi:ketosteroid isomerase-like protein
MTTTQEQQVLDTVKAFNRAFAQNDRDTYFSFIDDSLTVIIPACPYRIDGVGDDREEFEYSLDKGWTRVGFFQELQPNVQLLGNAAIVTYHSRGTYGTGDNERQRCFKETDVLMRKNGVWKIVHIHVSVTPS